WSTERSARFAMIACGFAIALAVQTLIAAAFAGTAVAVMALGTVYLQRPAGERRRLYLTFAVSGVVTFISAPIWYLLRGGWDEFYSGWWTYARFLSTGTGRSLGGQFALGWDQFYAYYEHRPLTALLIIAFFATVFLDWKTAEPRVRLIYATLIGWF